MRIARPHRTCLTPPWRTNSYAVPRPSRMAAANSSTVRMGGSSARFTTLPHARRVARAAAHTEGLPYPADDARRSPSAGRSGLRHEARGRPPRAKGRPGAASAALLRSPPVPARPRVAKGAAWDEGRGSANALSRVPGARSELLGQPDIPDEVKGSCRY
jgi:hypothetical protein